jgi:hypothetical protein
VAPRLHFTGSSTIHQEPIMKNLDKTSTPTTATEDLQLAGIDAVALDDVTGGCAACGQSCSAGATPGTVGSAAQNPLGALASR